MKEIKEELNKIKRQLKELTSLSLQMKNKNHEKKSKKTNYYFNPARTEAHRIACEWHEKRALKQNKKKNRKQDNNTKKI